MFAGGRVFVATRFDQALVEISPRTMLPVRRLARAAEPVRVVAGGGHVWVTSLGNDAITRVDLPTAIS